MALLICHPLGSGFCPPLFHFLPASPCSHAMALKLLVVPHVDMLFHAPVLLSFSFFCLTECLTQEGLSKWKLILFVVNDKTVSIQSERKALM